MLRFRADLELERFMEIQHWIDEHPDITNWVAVDDLNMSVDFLGPRFTDKNDIDKKAGLTNFVLNSRINEGIKQSGIKDKIIHYLLL
jgi:hypothetical protein